VPSIQSQVIAAVVTLLNGKAGAVASRTRFSAYSEAQLPAFNVIPDEGQPDYTDTDSIYRKFRFVVRHVGQAVDECDVIVDPLYVEGQKALFADTKLGGLVKVIREVGQKWEFEKGKLDTVALAVTYEVEFSTSRTDPSVASY
jgi:hypothetical protein